MKEAWVTKKLGEVCQLVNGGTPKTGVSEYWGGRHLWLTPAEMGRCSSPLKDATERTLTDRGLEKCSARLAPSYSVILSTRAPIGHLAINTLPMATNQGCKSLVPDKSLYYKYLYYYLYSIKKELDALGEGATFKELSGLRLKNVEISFPLSSVEQKRIVAILDATFADIAKAKTNAEKNLASARELFESELDKVEGLPKKLGDFSRIKTGKLDANAAVQGGQYPFFTCARTESTINDYAFDCEALLLAGNNASGDFNVKHYKGKFNAYQRTYVITLDATAEYRLIYYLLVRALSELKAKSVGAATKFLKIGIIQSLELPFPSLSEQKRIAARLDDLSAYCKKLEAIYTQKIALYDELKQSLMQKAFTGEL